MGQSGLRVRSEILEIWTLFARPVDAENTCVCNNLVCLLTFSWDGSCASVIVIRLLGEFFRLVAKTGHGQHSSEINCVVLCIVCVCVCVCGVCVCVCKCVLHCTVLYCTALYCTALY